MYEVLLAVDMNDERAESQAETVSNFPCVAEKCHVTLFHDFTENPNGASVHQVGAVRKAKERLEAAGITVTMAESSGEPASEILSAVEERDVDLICLAGRKRSPAKKALLGSVTQEVIQNTHRPVLVCDSRA